MPLLTDDALNELGRFLTSDLVSDETLSVDALDGYLTAIAIGPITLMPSQWIPGIWGPEPDDAPAFESKENAQRIMGLIIQLFNGIIETLEKDPDSLAPVFGRHEFPGDPHVYLDAEPWALGFMQGLHLCRPAWQPLFDDPNGQVLLRPLHLLGSLDLSGEEEALVLNPDQREVLSKQIPDSIAVIYSYWLPFRQAVIERELAKTVQRTEPKVGRNDPCPCGSGKKFKKCCGAGSVLH
jgi:uncharacterized protein